MAFPVGSYSESPPKVQNFIFTWIFRLCHYGQQSVRGFWCDSSQLQKYKKEEFSLNANRSTNRTKVECFQVKCKSTLPQPSPAQSASLLTSPTICPPGGSCFQTVLRDFVTSCLFSGSFGYQWSFSAFVLYLSKKCLGNGNLKTWFQHFMFDTCRCLSTLPWTPHSLRGLEPAKIDVVWQITLPCLLYQKYKSIGRCPTRNWKAPDVLDSLSGSKRSAVQLYPNPLQHIRDQPGKSSFSPKFVQDIDVSKFYVVADIISIPFIAKPKINGPQQCIEMLQNLPHRSQLQVSRGEPVGKRRKYTIWQPCPQKLGYCHQIICPKFLIGTDVSAWWPFQRLLLSTDIVAHSTKSTWSNWTACMEYNWCCAFICIKSRQCRKYNNW